MPTHLSSPQNPHIKELVRLEKRSVRDERRQTLVEGEREISRALAAGIIPDEVYLCPEIVEAARSTERVAVVDRLQQMAQRGQTKLFTVTPAIFAKLAYRGESGGLLLVVPYLQRRLVELPLRQPAFLAVIEGVEKPGNLGAILRTADAAGVDGIIVVAGGTDLHNPNVVRASLGTLFTVPVVAATLVETIEFLRQHNIQLIAADPAASISYTAPDFTLPSALALGSEAHGLSATIVAAASARVSIPMRGAADSLNLSTATAILLYEVVRQRGE